jgi:response regulator NasT
LRVLAVDPDPAGREFYLTALSRLGHEVQTLATGADLAAACEVFHPDLVLTGPDGLAATEAACRERPVPVVLVADSFEPLTVARALACQLVMGCLSRPVRDTALGAALAVAVSRFREQQALRAEVADLKQALEERKVIEQAKGSVMRRIGVSEEDAYRRLRKAASNTNRKVIDVAREVLAAEAPFAGLEAVRD